MTLLYAVTNRLQEHSCSFEATAYAAVPHLNTYFNLHITRELIVANVVYTLY